MAFRAHMQAAFGASACSGHAFSGAVLLPSARCGGILNLNHNNHALDFALIVLLYSIPLVLGLVRGWQLWKRPVVVQGSTTRTLKLALWHVLAAVQIAALVLAVVDGHNHGALGVLIASGALAIASSIFFVLISKLEHDKSLAPSALLQTFLLVTVIVDAARLGDLWIAPHEVGKADLALAAAQFAATALLLVAESTSKSAFVTIPAIRVSREERSGIFGRSLALWINPLLSLGWKKDLVVEDLEPVDDDLSSEKVLHRLSRTWENVDQTRTHALVLAVLKAFWLELFFIHIPRLGIVGFGLAQPLLVQTTIEYIQNHGDRPVGFGYGLIGAFALTYLGVAISTQWSGQLTNRLLTRIRGALIAIIYHNMLSLRAETGNSQAAVSLMSAEVERITVASQWCVAIVPNLIQVGFALRILSSQLGAIGVAPVVIALLSVSVSIKLGQLVPPRQRRWMQAIQKRVGITTEIMGSVKGIKMSGLTATVQDQIQGLRDFELDESKKFRKMQIANMLVGQFPSIMTPSITFAVFAVVQKLSNGEPLNVVQAFTSLSLLGILISPVSELVMIPNNLGSAIGCIDRIQEFLVKEKRDDYRHIKGGGPHENGTAAGDAPPGSRPLITVSGGSFGWHSDKAILHDLALEVRPSTLTMLVGPVGSGKSTLLKSLVGETYRISGTVEYSAAMDVAYCDQDPWILNQSIKDNIVGGAGYVPEFYGRVVKACQLEEDLGLLPQGDDTVVGSSGAALSGGQKHRIALARAVYSGNQVVIMDDNLKGLDSDTASKCFNAIFGAQGLLRDQNRAVLFATHNAQWLRFADQIIALGSDGTISERGSYEELSKTGGYVSTLKVSQLADHADDAGAAGETPQENGKQNGNPAAAAKTKDAAGSKARGAANTSSLVYYIRSMGTSAFFLFVAMVLLQMACRTMQRLWVKFWVAANESGGDQNLGMWVGVYILWGVSTELSLAIETLYFLVVIVPHSAKGLHFSVLKAALAAPLSFFVKTDAGVIINRFSQDMNLVDLPLPIAFMLTFDYLSLAVADLVLTCIATGYLALATPVLAAVLYAIQRVYLQTSRQVRLLDLEAKSPVFSHFLASFAGLVTVRALGRAADARAENLARLDLSQRAFYAMGSMQRWLLLVLNLVVAGLAVVLVALAVALRASVDPGLLGVALVSVMGFGHLLTQLLNYWAMLETSLGAVARIREFETGTPSEAGRGGEDPASLPAGGWPAAGAIELAGVSAAYDDHRVLRDVSLSVRPGEKVAICGRTGSGKSTLLALLLRLHEPSAGAVSIDGVDIARVPVGALREALVALPQDALFLPGTVRRNLDPLGGHGGDDDAVWAALGKTGLRALFEDKGGLDAELNTDWLSAGQKQLFCMARALLRSSRVLLLDEATSSLDQATEQVVQDLIRSEFRGWTVVVIAHRLRAVADFDKVVALQDGRVVEFDSPKALLEKGDGVFASLWRLQEGSVDGV
ncbi:hypothetical protein EsH8_VII_000428 [Colletotrichum jinshuiense]